jgi:glucosyl-dolichyl phosphate glucuronosyltransferase
MRLDILVPTHNRSVLLAAAVTVVDNRSTDNTRAVVESFREQFDGRLQYLYEPAPGRSYALNSGIRATSGDLVGMIDDDEEVDGGWLRCVEQAFQDPSVDFIGGPYVPRWGADRPRWFSDSYRGTVGWVDGGRAVHPFGPGFEGMLMGGNAVIRRAMLERVGPYAVDLGRTATRLMSCEDEDMYKRLLAAGARGFYRPDLVIFHFVPPQRLTKRYFRNWCFWRGVSLGILDRRQPEPVTYLLGVPRYMIGKALRGTLDTLRAWAGPADPSRTFTNELAWWDLAGFVYGKHLRRDARPAGADLSPDPARMSTNGAG